MLNAVFVLRPSAYGPHIQMIGRALRQFDVNKPNLRQACLNTVFETFAPRLRELQAQRRPQQALVIDLATNGHLPHFKRILRQEGRPLMTQAIQEVAVPAISRHGAAAGTARTVTSERLRRLCILREWFLVGSAGCARQ